MKSPKRRRPPPMLTEKDIAITLEVLREHPGFGLVPERLAWGLDLADTLRYGSLLEHLKLARSEKGLSVARAANALAVPVAKVRVVESGPVSQIEPAVFLRYLVLIDAGPVYERWKRLHPVLAARLEGLPPPPAHPWTGRPAEFEEAYDPSIPPKAGPRTARVLRAARARYPRVYRIHVELAGIRPPIWRRMMVAEGATLHELHLALQEAMGWRLSHLYQFTAGERHFMEPDPDGEDDRDDTFDSRIVLLGDLGLKEGDRLGYLYDFGDGWDHAIRVEGIGDHDPAQPLPACTAGRRACPPEDVGGTGGYQDMLVALADPKHPEHRSMLEWLGRPYDPEHFEPGWANEMLKREQALWRRRMGGPKARES